ncbi:MAG: cytochrome [Fibrobacteres bacterium]|nr:cytochrome [Fibrobacterota bacterium]
MKTRVRIVLLSCALGSWFFFGCAAGRRSEPLRGSLDVSNPKVAHGQVVFMNQCDKCHPGGDAGLGPSLNNKPLPGFLLGFQARHGMGAMPAFDKEELPQTDLDDVVAYLKALRRNG